MVRGQEMVRLDPEAIRRFIPIGLHPKDTRPLTDVRVAAPFAVTNYSPEVEPLTESYHRLSHLLSDGLVDCPS